MKLEWYQNDMRMEFDSWYLLFGLLIPNIKIISVREVGNQKFIFEEFFIPSGMSFNLENYLNKY